MHRIVKSPSLQTEPVLIPLNQRIGTQVHVYKRKEGYFISIPLNPSFVIRMGLEPMTPTLKVLCSTS